MLKSKDEGSELSWRLYAAAMARRDGEMTELTLAEADRIVPGLAAFVADGGAPPHPSFVPSSQRRDERRSNAGWGAVVLAFLGALVIPIAILNASRSGATWYLFIVAWAFGLLLAVRKWLALRGRRDEAPRDGMFILDAALLVVTEATARHIPAGAVVDLAVVDGKRPGTTNVRVRAETRRSGSPWTDLGVFDTDAAALGARLRAWAPSAG